MLDVFKRWLRRTSGKPGPGRPEVAAWAQRQGWDYRAVRDCDGFVVECRTGTVPWRIEWGPSQRNYIEGQELRMRSELPVASELQSLILSRSLMASMESAVFDQYIEGVQTRIDTEIPPEMRWLVMYPKLGSADLKLLRERFCAVSNLKPWTTQWLSGALTPALLAAPAQDPHPLVMMVARARLVLRTPLAEPVPASLDAWCNVFQVAMLEARRASLDEMESSGASTQPSLWAASAMPPAREAERS